VRILMVMFPPQALHALSGLDLSACVDQLQPVGKALGPEWGAMADAVLAATEDAARIRILEEFLEPRWQSVRAADGALAQAGDWLQHLAMQAAVGGIGRGVRNMERRIKAWAGQPMRKLRRMQRSEESFFRARDAIASGDVSWADLASRAGYSDQAHFCRETREITGHSPAELARVSDDDETYWIYRVWS
jgi:methylphosphotriester-DNA--protein-cysteine methyltransferase